MSVCDIERKLNKREKVFYWVGICILTISFITTFILGRSLSPLFILYIRLSTVGIWLSYCLSIYFYYSKAKVQTVSPRQDGVIIMFNGRELGYK